MQKLTARQYAEVLYKATKGLRGEELHAAIRAFVVLLARNQRLKQAGRIVNEFLTYAKKEEGVVVVEITSAHGLDESTVKKIKGVFGDKVEADLKVDESLLGGIKVRTEDKILDASLKTQLIRLKKSLL